MRLRIDWARLRDAERALPLFFELYAHDAPDRALPSADEARAHVARLLAPEVPHRVALAWSEEGEAVGLAAIAVFQSVADARLPQGRQMEMKELFVHPGHRGAGIGAALMGWVRAQATAQGAGRIDWHVDDHNARGQAFYRREGARFVPYRLSMRIDLDQD